MCVAWLANVMSHKATSCETWLTYVCGITNSCVRHDSCMRSVWLMHVFGMTHSCVRYDSFTTRPSKFKTVPQCSKIMAIRIDHPNLNKQFSHQAHLLSKRTFCLSSPVVPLHLFISRILYPHTPHSVGSTRCGRAAGLGSNIAQNQNTALTLRRIKTLLGQKVRLNPKP